MVRKSYLDLNKRLVDISDQFYFYLKYCDLNTRQKVFKFRYLNCRLLKGKIVSLARILTNVPWNRKPVCYQRAALIPNLNGSRNQLPGIQIVNVPKFKCIAELTFNSSAVLNLRLGTHHRMNTHTFLQKHQN